MSEKRAIPLFDHPLIETHCHLDYLRQSPLEEIIGRAREVGVERIITIAVDPGNLAAVRELAAAHEMISGTQGVHPHEARQFDDAVDAEICSGLAEPGIVAVGEIGLDYYYEHSAPEVQRRVFARQLRIAAEVDMPVVIHSRDAEADTQAMLAEHGPALARKGVIHSFTASTALAEFCLDAGFMLGFNGIITFPKADNVREVVTLTPPERMLIETDSPYLTPVPYRGRENAPFYIPFVAEKIAQIKQMSLEELLPVLYRNSLELFFPAATD